MTAILKQVVQTWQDGDGSYTVTITYDDAGNVVSTSGAPEPAEIVAATTVEQDAAYDAAVAKVKEAVIAGEVLPAQAEEAIKRLNRERDEVVVPPIIAPPVSAVADVATSESDGVFISTDLTSHDQAAEAVERLKSGASDEPPMTAGKRGPLPADFPHRDALAAAGYGAYAKLRDLLATGPDWYKQVPGIGEKTAPAIEEAFAA